MPVWGVLRTQSACNPLRLERSVGVVVTPSSMISCSLMLVNRCSLRHSSRSRPLKLSTKPFCIGLPGAM